MAMQVKIYSENDMKRIVKSELDKKLYALELSMNTLRGKVIDIEKILEYQNKKFRENR